MSIFVAGGRKWKTKISLGLLMRTSKQIIFGHEKWSHSASVPFMAIPMSFGVRKEIIAINDRGFDRTSTTGGDEKESYPRLNSFIPMIDG